jgi:hypothetical protein
MWGRGARAGLGGHPKRRAPWMRCVTPPNFLVCELRRLATVWRSGPLPRVRALTRTPNPGLYFLAAAARCSNPLGNYTSFPPAAIDHRALWPASSE